MNKKKNDHDLSALENARLSYETAINLWIYQGNLNWNRFTVMLTANSILLSLIGFTLLSQSFFTIYKVLLIALGFVLCISWIFLMARGFDYHAYWGSQALKLERKPPLQGNVDIVSNARIFYKLTTEAFHSLKEQNIPTEVLNNIQPLIEKDYSKKKIYSMALKDLLEKNYYNKYGNKIIKISQQGEIKFSFISNLGGSQRNSTYLVIFIFVVLYIFALFQIRI